MSSLRQGPLLPNLKQYCQYIRKKTTRQKEFLARKSSHKLLSFRNKFFSGSLLLASSFLNK